MATPLTKGGKTDTDNDGLTDSEEVNWSMITITKDGFKLPTLQECMNTKKGYVINGLKRIHPTICERAKNISILPILSDPTKKDSDGDDINDSIDIEPLKSNTIEAMFNLSKQNKETNQIYVEIEKNEVTITTHINFTGDANDNFPCTNKTYAEVAIQGIKDKWKKDSGNPIIGTNYDFVPGLKGKLNTNIIYHIPGESYFDKAGQKYFNLHIDNSNPGFWDKNLGGIFGEEHIPHMEGGWSLPQVGRITMYKRDQRSKSDYSQAYYGATVAHEFGHILGLGDAYPEANDGKRLVNNAEISDGKFGETGSIMFRNGLVYSNDVEMMLEAFSTNEWQYPIDKKSHKKSRVIRLPQEFIKKKE